MAAAATLNPASKTASKTSSKKKKSRSEEVDAPASAPVASEEEPSNGLVENSNGDGSFESPYLKDLYKYVSTDM